MQIHLSLTGNPSEMRVMWITGGDQPYPPTQLSAVQYGLAPDKLTELAVSDRPPHTYRAGDNCGPPANIEHPRWFRHPGFIHDVKLTGLETGRVTYYYRVGTADNMTSSEVFSFVSAPAVSDSDSGDMRMIVYGDVRLHLLLPTLLLSVLTGLYVAKQMGDGTNSDFCGCSGAAGTANRVLNDVEAAIGSSAPVDVVLHIGDLSYARGVGYSWEWFFNLIFWISTAVPYMIGPGNHEICHTSGGQHDPSQWVSSGVGRLR